MKSFGNVGTYVKFGKFRIKATCLMADNFELLHLHFFRKWVCLMTFWPIKYFFHAL